MKEPTQSHLPRRRVLITGVYGLIGSLIYERMQQEPDRYEVHGLARRRVPSERVSEEGIIDIPEDRFVLSDMSDLDVLERAFEDMDVVIHMAACPDSLAPWEPILQSNIIGTHNVLEAARRAGVRRVVYASSIMVSWGWRTVEPYLAITEGRFADVPGDYRIIDHTEPPRPLDHYSASKVWGEAAARMYADAHGMSCLCLRIGWVNAENHWAKPELKDVWCSQRDIYQLTKKAVDAPDDLRFDVFYGVSDNPYRWVDIQHARDVLGYIPQD